MSYGEVLERIAEAERRLGRTGDSVTVVAVSKTKTPDEVMALYEMGHRDFGENRAAEMAEKAAVLPRDINWHFVGALQSNKARLIRPSTSLLHSMDRLSLAAAWMKGAGLAPPVLVQVNVGAESQKSGAPVDEAPRLVSELISLGVDVKGLMAIPPVSRVPEESRPFFRLLATLRSQIAAEHPSVTELSMGMSDDFEVAIEEGASLIRVGRAIFGPRN